MCDSYPSLRKTEYLSNVFISVKTSFKFGSSRLPPILTTWYPSARNSTFFFSDESKAGEEAPLLEGGHLVTTNCPSDHSRRALCCKMQAELETFLLSPRSKDWFCHLDDDNYLHVPGLLSLLGGYRADKAWYLGKASTSQPLTLRDRQTGQPLSFRFATGGAGFCLSRPLVEIMDVAQLMKVGDSIGLPDDVTVGFLAEVRGKVALTQVSAFHSHLEPLERIDRENLREIITFSYKYSKDTPQGNVINAQPEGSEGEDDTRFRAAHKILNDGNQKLELLYQNQNG